MKKEERGLHGDATHSSETQGKSRPFNRAGKYHCKGQKKGAHRLGGLVAETHVGNQKPLGEKRKKGPVERITLRGGTETFQCTRMQMYRKVGRRDKQNPESSKGNDWTHP